MTASPGKIVPIADRAHGCYIEAGGPHLSGRLRRRDGDAARPLPPAGGRGTAAAGRRARVHVPLLVPKPADARPRRARSAGSPRASSSGASSTRPAPRPTSRRCTSRCSTGSCRGSPRRSSSCRASRAITGRLSERCRCRGRAGARRSSCSCRSTPAVPNSATAEEGAAALEAAIQSRGADHVAAFVVEPMTGSSGAAVDLPDGYLQRGARGVRPPRGAADRRRDHHRLRPHRQVVCERALRRDSRCDHVRQGHRRRRRCRSRAWWRRGRSAKSCRTSPTGFSYGHTFSGYPLGCAVGCEVIDIVEDEGLVQASEQKGARLRGMLEELQGRHPIMHALRGRGLLQGVELRRPDGERVSRERWDVVRRSPGRRVSAT